MTSENISNLPIRAVISPHENLITLRKCTFSETEICKDGIIIVSQ